MLSVGQYSVLSLLAAVGIIVHAFYTREQFFPAMVYLSTSKVSLVAMGNMAFVIVFLFGLVVKKLFLGRLREAEVERLHEMAKNELMETCLAMTVFRGEFNLAFVVMFTALFFVKVFHWLCQKRLEFIETTPAISRISHIRISAFMTLLLVVDCWGFYRAASVLWRTRQASVLVLFAFEYFILSSTTLANMIKYGFHIADMTLDGQWEGKATCVFYLELARDLLHLIVYMVFFGVLLSNYGLPLHLLRDLYETFRNFRMRVGDFIRYRQITSNLNDRFPDATPEELERSDNTCIVCREEMASGKKLPCNHIFHVHCLRSWLERQQTCPTCRASLLAPDNNPPHAQPPPPAAAAGNGAAVQNPQAAAGEAARGGAAGGVAAAGGGAFGGGAAGHPFAAAGAAAQNPLLHFLRRHQHVYAGVPRPPHLPPSAAAATLFPPHEGIHQYGMNLPAAPSDPELRERVRLIQQAQANLVAALTVQADAHAQLAALFHPAWWAAVPQDATIVQEVRSNAQTTSPVVREQAQVSPDQRQSEEPSTEEGLRRRGKRTVDSVAGTSDSMNYGPSSSS